MGSDLYRIRRESRSGFIDVRGLRTHVLEWGDASLAAPEQPTLVMVHGWMDVGASFQFVIDAMRIDRHVISLDWRGFGLTEFTHADTYWFADYLGDLDNLLDQLLPDQRIDLCGHSMGGNVAMLYAGLRPERIRKLINLEGFGAPATQPSDAPEHYVKWLDELKQPQRLHTYTSVEAVAGRLMQNNPLLPPERARWLAQRWSRQRADGRFEILGDATHKRRSPALYQKPEVLAIWKRIIAPVLWAEGNRTDIVRRWNGRYTREEFESRLAVIAHLHRHVISPAGHMLHHDQPEQLAGCIEDFLCGSMKSTTS